MSGRKSLLLVSLVCLPLAGCWDDANTYPFPLADMKYRLADEKLTYYYKDKAFHLSIKGEHGNSVLVTIDSPETYTRSECIIRLEAVDLSSTRLVPDCGTSDNEYKQESLDAIEDTIAEKARVILLGEEAAAQAAS
jgi:hypothetical protein